MCFQLLQNTKVAIFKTLFNGLRVATLCTQYIETFIESETKGIYMGCVSTKVQPGTPFTFHDTQVTNSTIPSMIINFHNIVNLPYEN